MFLKVYSIFDSKAQAYGNPFYCRNSAEAIRTFEQIFTSKDPRHAESPMIQFPADFHLYEIGDFDVDTGTISGQVHISLAAGNQYLS